MPVVTALRAQPRGRVAVDLDETPWRTLPADAVVRAGLRVGCELDRPTARRLRRELRHAEALGVAVGSLRARDLSARALEERLQRRKVAPDARKEALEALQRAGIVDDGRFALSRASALAGRGYGDGAIAADLDRRGVEPQTSADALAALPPEPDRAREVVAKRGRGVKTARYLASKGFGAEAIEAALGAGFANRP
jgi:SOS response regulatory protein OraA/RecX